MWNTAPDLARLTPSTELEFGSLLHGGKDRSPTDFASLVTKAVELAKMQENLALASSSNTDEPADSGEQQLYSALDLYNLVQTGSGQQAHPGLFYPSSMARLLHAPTPAIAAPAATPGSSTAGPWTAPADSSLSSPVNLGLEVSGGGVSKNRFVEWMDRHALTRSVHHCAAFVRRGLEAAGMITSGHPVDAGDYGPFLLEHGARVVDAGQGYTPQAGDTAVFDKTDQHPNGHIEVFDGEQWVSDFRQHSFSPYRDPETTPPVTVYRISS